MAPGFSRSIHYYETSGAGRVDYQYHDAYTGGAYGDPHPVVFIRAINLSSHQLRPVSTWPTPRSEQDILTMDEDLNDLLVGRLANVALPPKPTGELKFYFEHNLSDLWIAVTWSG